MSVRCKFLCESIEPAFPQAPNSQAMRVSLMAVWDSTVPEDRRFTKATPQGGLNVVIDSPAALEHLKVGAYYYLDLTPVATP